jgi:hypothetical protein
VNKPSGPARAEPSHPSTLAALAARFACSSCLLVASGCSDPPALDALILAEQFDAVGVVRVFPDGLTPRSLDAFAMSFRSVRVSGGRALAEVERKGLGSSAIMVSGTFEEDTGRLQFDLAQGALTSTRSEAVAIAGMAEDGFPEDDGVADHVTGFVRAEIDLVVREGQFLAVSPNDLRPAPIDDTKVAAVDRMDGTVSLEGSAGAAIASVAVELLRFTVTKAEPDFRVFEANGDGSFSQTVTGLRGDIFLVRNSPAGRRSDARIVRVP